MMQEVEVLKTIQELICSFFSEEQFTLSRCMEIIDSPSDSCKMVLVVIKEVPYKIERCRVRRRQ